MHDGRIRVNVGCGRSPTDGWLNLDNSPSLWLAHQPALLAIATRLALLDHGQREYVDFARTHAIAWADATRRIPLPDGAAEVVYSSHMVEHLDRTECDAFLREARRVLRPGGVIRIAVPDLQQLVDTYQRDGDADRLVERLYLSVPKPRSLRERLVRVLAGDRHHHWMYDECSLRRLLEHAGFTRAQRREPGTTGIPDPGALNLLERADESLYVEAVRP